MGKGVIVNVPPFVHHNFVTVDQRDFEREAESTRQRIAEAVGVIDSRSDGWAQALADLCEDTSLSSKLPFVEAAQFHQTLVSIILRLNKDEFRQAGLLSDKLIRLHHTMWRMTERVMHDLDMGGIDLNG